MNKAGKLITVLGAVIGLFATILTLQGIGINNAQSNPSTEYVFAYVVLVAIAIMLILGLLSLFLKVKYVQGIVVCIGAFVLSFSPLPVVICILFSCTGAILTLIAQQKSSIDEHEISDRVIFWIVLAALTLLVGL